MGTYAQTDQGASQTAGFTKESHVKATKMPSRPAAALTRFDLAQLKPGQTVNIRTQSSSYYVTASQRLTSHNAAIPYVRGVSVQTSSYAAMPYYRMSPSQTAVGRFVAVGEEWIYGEGNAKRLHTSTVTYISLD